MTNRQAIGFGLLCGITLGVVGCVGVLYWTGERLNLAQAEAFDEGSRQGYQRAQQERSMVSSNFNQAVLADNEALGRKLDAALGAVKPLADRTDLPEEMRAAVGEALRALE